MSSFLTAVKRLLSRACFVKLFFTFLFFVGAAFNESFASPRCTHVFESRPSRASEKSLAELQLAMNQLAEIYNSRLSAPQLQKYRNELYSEFKNEGILLVSPGLALVDSSRGDRWASRLGPAPWFVFRDLLSLDSSAQSAEGFREFVNANYPSAKFHKGTDRTAKLFVRHLDLIISHFTQAKKLLQKRIPDKNPSDEDLLAGLDAYYSEVQRWTGTAQRSTAQELVALLAQLQIKLAHAKFRGTLYLYGSAINGRVSTGSDLDVVTFDGQLPRAKAERIDLSKFVDTFPLTEVQYHSRPSKDSHGEVRIEEDLATLIELAPLVVRISMDGSGDFEVILEAHAPRGGRSDWNPPRENLEPERYDLSTLVRKFQNRHKQSLKKAG